MQGVFILLYRAKNMHGIDMFPEIVRLDILNEISGFERSVFNKLLPCFDDIEQEAKQRSGDYLHSCSENFDPERDDEGCIEDDALSVELHYMEFEANLKQNFLNSCAVELYHLLEKRLKAVFGGYTQADIEPKININGYDITQCSNWALLNQELRHAANTIKHGIKGSSGQKLKQQNSPLISIHGIEISEADLREYVAALQSFWDAALDKRIIC